MVQQAKDADDAKLSHLANRWVDVETLYDLGAYKKSGEDRNKIVEAISKPLKDSKPGELGEVKPMGFVEEALACLFLFFVVGAMLWVPVALALLAVFVRSLKFWAVFLVVLAVLGHHPISFWPAFLHCRLNKLLFRYFSFRMAWVTPLRDNEPYLMIAPPHGTFPYANILAVHGMRNVTGFDFRGITTDAALTTPIVRHYLTWIGVIAATAKNVKKHIENGWSIGINSGGVAEIFETNAEDEVVLMSERKGFVKLALRTGATIVPCYMFGNTALLSLWYDRFGILQALSRRVKFGVCLLWGRFGLPIMYRQPCLGATGRPIRVPKVEGEPTQEMIDKYHKEFMDSLREVFETFKPLYGWPDKKLVLK